MSREDADEKIIKIRFLTAEPRAIPILACNEESIQLWKVSKRSPNPAK